MNKKQVLFLYRMGVCLFAVLAIGSLGCLSIGAGALATLCVTALFAGCGFACLQQVGAIRLEIRAARMAARVGAVAAAGPNLHTAA